MLVEQVREDLVMLVLGVQVQVLEELVQEGQEQFQWEIPIHIHPLELTSGVVENKRILIRLKITLLDITSYS